MSRQAKCQVRCQDIVTTQLTNNNFNDKGRK